MRRGAAVLKIPTATTTHTIALRGSGALRRRRRASEPTDNLSVGLLRLCKHAGRECNK